MTIKTINPKTVPENKSYWTAWIFPDGYHVTHKFLGHLLTPADILTIKKIIEDYFLVERSWRISPRNRWVFDKPSMFGPNKDVYVLKLTTKVDMDELMIPLRNLLNAYYADTFPEYIPHITVPNNTYSYEAIPKKYALMYGDKSIKIWDY